MTGLSRRSALVALASAFAPEECTMSRDQNERLVGAFFQTMLKSEGIAEAVTKARFGRTIRLQPQNTGEALSCYAGPPPLGMVALISQPRILFKQTIARISAEDLMPYSYLPGEWKLSLDARPVRNEQNEFEASEFYPGERLVSPVVASLTFGTGGASHTIEMDAIGNTISLPALDVTVDVGISQTCGDTLDGGETQVGLFSEYEVRAVLHKSSGNVVNATRTILNYAPFVAFPVYNFAGSWCYVPATDLPFGTAITGGSAATCYANDGDVSGSTPPFPDVVEIISGDIVANNARNHCFRKFHPHARSILLPLVDATGGETTYPGSLVQRLEF